MTKRESISIDYKDFEILTINTITQLYELRHAVNIAGEYEVSTKLEMDPKHVIALYESEIHGSTKLKPFLDAENNEEFKKLIKKEEDKNSEIQIAIDNALHRNENAVDILKDKRKSFAGLGTNKVKRRLNRLAITNVIAKAVRIALEIEDKNINAKQSFGKYQKKIYNKKTELIFDLCKLFQQQKWVFGVHKSQTPPTSHIIFFEIPNCEQISWHFDPGKQSYPKYKGQWDRKENSTLRKLEVIAIELLKNY